MSRIESARLAPPTSPRDADEVNLLLQFVHERDVECPRCGYNIRNLTQPICPECREELLLKVGVLKIKLHWLLLTLAPGFFCAIVMGIFVVMTLRFGPPGGMPLEGVLIMCFIGASGLAAVLFFRQYRRFLRLSNQAQMTWALSMWGVHIAVFIMAMIYM
jgi:hypothetical protein